MVTPIGPTLYSSQSIGTNTPDILDWYGQACFSPDGSKYALALARTQSVELFDFDRCTGEFSNPRYILINDSTAGLLGCSFSSDSRFLYTSSDTYVYQLDTWSSNIDSSKQIVATYDGFVGNFQTKFFYHQLAEDGKIYISTINGDSVLHSINQPNLYGINCDVQQHSHTLPHNNNFSLNNFPNYHLGALSGSPCDTLTSLNGYLTFEDLILNVSPNPSFGKSIYVKYKLDNSEQGVLNIFDVNGLLSRTVTLPKWSSYQEISISNLSSGVYIVKLSSGRKSTIQRFINFKE